MAVAVIGCDPGKAVVEEMLENARRGEDTGAFWLGGSARQELFNVLFYEVLSQRPLKEAIKPHYSRTHRFLETLITDLETAKTDHEAQAEEHRHAAEEFRQKASQWPEAEERRAQARVDEAKEVVKRTRGEAYSIVQHQRAVDAHLERRLELKRLLTHNKTRRERALRDAEREDELARREDEAAILAAQKKPKVQEVLGKLEEMYEGLDTGVAYKVRVDSTNRAGQAIHILWTVTALKIPGEREWKVTYMFDERDFSERDLDVDTAEELLLIGSAIRKLGEAR